MIDLTKLNAIKIGSREIKVSIGDIGQNWGMYNPETFEIILSNTIGDNLNLFEETFFHELKHAINDYCRFEVMLRTELSKAEEDGVGQYQSFDFEELITEMESKVWYEVLKDNNLMDFASKAVSQLSAEEVGY